MKELPHKPSDLITVALADLEKAEASKKYRINMRDWHRPKDDGICEVCLAGTVMAFSLESNPDSKLTPSTITNTSTKESSKLTRQLSALDWLRQGDISDAFSELEYSDEYNSDLYDYDNGEEFDRDIVDYSDDPTRFKKEMRLLAADLKKAGY